jgi:hypothetical protein
VTTTSPDIKLTSERRALIRGLQNLGGSLEANGDSNLSPKDVVKKLNLKQSPNRVTGFLRNNEEAGIITRDVDRQARTTRAIYLHPNFTDLDVGTGKPGRPKGGGKKIAPLTVDSRVAPMARRSKKVPLPSLGTVTEVSMQTIDRDGTQHLGIRTDEGTWMVTVNGFAPSDG